MVHGLCCSQAWETSPDQGSNPCVLHWEADFFFSVNKMFISVPTKYQEALNISSSNTPIVLAVILNCLLKDHAS